MAVHTWLSTKKFNRQPCFCLCLGLLQITITLPSLLMILHFSQIGFTDGFTFMETSSFFGHSSFPTPCDAPARQIIGGQLDRNFISGQYPDKMHP
jgi:hypothetical protein